MNNKRRSKEIEQALASKIGETDGLRLIEHLTLMIVRDPARMTKTGFVRVSSEGHGANDAESIQRLLTIWASHDDNAWIAMANSLRIAGDIRTQRMQSGRTTKDLAEVKKHQLS